MPIADRSGARPNVQSPEHPSRIIVFGSYSSDWDKRVDADAPVWKGMLGVSEVTRARTLPQLILRGLFDGRPSVVLALRERFLACSPPFWWGLMPSRRAFLACRDKARFAAFTRSAGLEDLVPRTYADLDAAAFPLVLKRTNKAGGYGVAIIASKQELLTRKAQKPWRGRKTILQELLPGHVDHVTHAVARHGRILWHCSYRYDLDAARPLQSAQTIEKRSRHVAAMAHIAAFERFLVPLDYSGAVSFDYRLMPDGGLKVFEINPRFGGSMMRAENLEDMRQGIATLIAASEPPRWRLFTRRA